jgi:tripartite-type tricarboxylate transporter receptor subunit TctC
LAGEWLKLKTGIDMLHVPYKVGPEAVAGLLSGQVQMAFGEIAGILPLARQGQVRAIAIASLTRDPRAPEIATFIEQGVPDFVVATFTGVLAPPATPPAIVARLHDAINTTLATPDVRIALETLGSNIRPGSVEEFAAFITAERRKWDEVVMRAGIKAE